MKTLSLFVTALVALSFSTAVFAAAPSAEQKGSTAAHVVVKKGKKAKVKKAKSEKQGSEKPATDKKEETAPKQ